MGMELISTGFGELDRAIGGGLLPDSHLLVVQETHSWGWLLALGILEARIRAGDFGVLMNSVLPLSSLEIELEPVGISLGDLMARGGLVIVDVFASAMGIEYPEESILTIRNFSPETFVPKYFGLYMDSIYPRVAGRRPVGVDFTLDGLAFLMGETSTIRAFQRFIAIKEEHRIKGAGIRPVNVFVVNRDRVSRAFISWFSLQSQYVIETVPESSSRERIIVRKSPLAPDIEGELFLRRHRRLTVERLIRRR